MKKGILLFITLIMLAACGKTPAEVETTKPESKKITMSATTEANTIVVTTVATISLPSSEALTIPDAPYYTKELSRDGEYKLMEMYVYDDDWNTSKRITFELPIEWRGDYSVFTNAEDFQYTLKVDMWNVLSITRDDVLAENSMSDEPISIISEKRRRRSKSTAADKRKDYRKN